MPITESDQQEKIMKPYIRKVQYYETDMMGIVHHVYMSIIGSN